MDRLARLREIVRGSVPRPHVPHVRELTYEPVGADGLPLATPGPPVPALSGARAIDTPLGPSVVVEHCYPGDAAYGGLARVEHFDLVDADALALLTGTSRRRPVAAGAPVRPVFFDIETTGLSGGAGTVAFLVGMGAFDEGGFRTTQFFLNGFAGERALLAAVAAFMKDRPLLVTYNGRSFDVPVMETRWSFHRLPPAFDEVAHVDMLPPARRLWKAAAEGDRSCRLVALEDALFGMARVGDVPGWEIPQRYFEFVRSGDPAPLEPVLQHNRLDLLSLAALTARAQRLVREGPDAAVDHHERLALGRLYERAGRIDEAERCYHVTATHRLVERVVAEEAWHRLAKLLRRQRRFEEAALAWRELLSLGRRGSMAAREAVHALAVHHEHRIGDLARARALALRALASEVDSRRRDAVRHRLARLDRKLACQPATIPLAAPLLKHDD